MANKDLVIVEGLLDTCRVWQEAIDLVEDPEQKAAMATQACESVRNIDGYFGTRKVIVKSGLAFILKGHQTEDEQTTGISYEEITARGNLGLVNHAEILGYNALIWSLYDAEILREPKVRVPDGAIPLGDNQPPQTDRTPRPIHMPVGFIDYALCAA